MKRSLLFIVCVGVLASGAWAQDKRLISATTPSGCSLSMEIFWGMRKFDWTGECKNNLLEGNGVLSFESSQRTDKDGSHIQWENKWVQSGLMREGKPVGLWMLADKKDKTIGFSSFQDGYRRGSTFFGNEARDSTKKNSYSNIKAWLDEWSSGNMNTPRYAYLMAGLNAYFENPSKFFSGQFNAPASSAAPAQPATNPAPQGSSADDPKVLGRSARGG